MKVTCLVLLCGVACAFAAGLPPFFTACSKSDPKLSECIEKVIANGGAKFTEGIPELGIAPLDPVQLGTVYVDNPSLKLIFTDTVVTGLKGFRVNSYKINLEKKKAMFDFTANVTLKAHYDMNGQILILPIKGKGQSKIKITNLNIVVKYDFEDVNGHWVIPSYKDHYKMDRAQFKFNNLFNGNKELGDTIHTVINTNWEPVIKELAPVAFEQIIKSCVNESKKLFAVVPLSELLTS